MKTIKKISFWIMLLSVIQMNAQLSIKPFEATINYDKSQRPCIQVNLDPEPKALKKAWRAYLKDNYDFKLKGIGFLSNKDLLSAEDITVEKISSNALDFYTRVIEDENGSEMKVFVRHGYDIYISKKNYPKEYERLYDLLNRFIKSYLPKYYRGNITDTEKRISALSEEGIDLRKHIDENFEEIEKLKNEIEEKEEEVISNKEKLELAERKLIKRKEKLERIKNQLKKL